MPRGGKCSHKNCYNDCRMLTDAELTPDAEDIEFGRQLVAEGWVQTSRKFRHVAKLSPDYPTAEQMIRPEVINTPEGRKLVELWNRHRSWLSTIDPKYVLTRTLTVKQFVAFRQAGGQS